MSKTWEGGSTRAWRKVRAFVLERDGYRCQVRRDNGCTTVATHGHHLGGREVTGDDPDFVVASCEHCNLSEGDPRAHDPAPQPRTRW
ncbi:HNH endonuclease [Amycolatopsis sp. H20-H5]|uniref:HNH endonuclease n=1 Tax=Amycolatopsis sp. H20-H5 TaxID=3046309 RepID=UPI002DBBF987|nr:hypothetical protein [Amycolatopsis sp. H20-H5]MEC3975097.1 hypothetical protein [Amycolatopsis sp. H20-H5]